MKTPTFCFSYMKIFFFLFNFGGIIIRGHHLTENDFDDDEDMMMSLSLAVKDIIIGLPSSHVTLLFENITDSTFPMILSKTLQKSLITTSIYTIEKGENQKEVEQEDLMHRKILYILYRDHNLRDNDFFSGQFEAMRISLLTKTQNGMFVQNLIYNRSTRYKYVDPPERLQGTGIFTNGTFSGVLGQVWQREFDFFMGDVTITYDRAKTVEFTFFTLVDSEAFVTHRPSKLNEAFALIRPFQWQVWPPILCTFTIYGPILFFIIESQNYLMKIKRDSKERKKLFFHCVWFSISTFLKQGGIYPSKSHKVRLLLIIVTLAATYVIGDMYSANLTSLLARPGREKPITVLEQLDTAMETRGYQLLVEKHSSSLTTLQNGTGIYEKIWEKMKNQKNYLIESVESGMKMVRKNKNIVILGGRETLYFDSRRFGSYNFQMSEKLNTRYAGIAMQLGCPYIENFNKILMQLFEGGILTKMTVEEYERLGEEQRAEFENVKKKKNVSQIKNEDIQNVEEEEEEILASHVNLDKDEKESNHQNLGCFLHFIHRLSFIRFYAFLRNSI
ncbi:glutamate receptor U1 precursor, putative [Pediculus humanus corporis]|uniref:Glutamate receptor U1, putative n=1 Tax=Pediculus humanus subsp. corporis TaxID=121224 RepID=E0VIY3_PEDHC|nr:glutamate receptor U1 precursor, putative [Pediculus humanus corporis]EEB13339.1 glutamate receptor U1 precursor, putative [Pediculus humanus corporis]